MDHLVSAVRALVPEYGDRPMTFEDFLAACDAQQIVVELRRHPLDEQLVRKPLAKIILNTGLSERYRTFVGFHALAHWLGHPAPQVFYLGSPGWLDRIEIEASTIGFLALSPHENGPPYPRLVRARIDRDQIEFHVEHPRVEADRVRWKRRMTRLARRAQMELQWPPQQLDLRFREGTP